MKFTNVFDCSLKDLFDYEEFLSESDLKKKNQEKILKFNDKKLNLCKSIIELIDNFCT